MKVPVKDSCTRPDVPKSNVTIPNVSFPANVVVVPLVKRTVPDTRDFCCVEVTSALSHPVPASADARHVPSNGYPAGPVDAGLHAALATTATVAARNMSVVRMASIG